MFNWFGGKKKKEDGKRSKLNGNSSDSGVAIPVMLASGLDDEIEKPSHDNPGKSNSAGHDYSSGSQFDGGGSGGGSD